MKFLIFLLFFVLLAHNSPPRILKILRLLSQQCSNHGYLLKKNECVCMTSYRGFDCSQKKVQETSDDADDICDDLINRLDNLYNISPDFYLFDDDQFPRIGINSIDGTQRNNGTWTTMHDIDKNFHIFSEETSALDVGQGSLKDCYLLSAFASLANRNNGSVLKNMFMDVNDNAKHVYVTKWLINGKPRFVAVDDWVPGLGSNTSFSRVNAGKNFWPLILEKAYAKIHGSYQIITGGWQAAVWSSISLARTFHQLHKKINATYLFDLLRHLFSQNYVVGALTFFRGVKNEAVAHAYSVLGIYEITTDDGNNVKLVRYFNPWHLDVWTSNPWGDDSHNWTNHTKSQVPYLQGNDGIVFSSIEDYYANFAVTNWAEIHDNYDVSFIDIANNFDDFNFHVFEVNFTYNGDADKDFYIFNDQSDGRLLLGCSAPVSISGFTVTNQRGTVYNEDSLGLVKIINPQVGLYKAKFSIKRNQKYVKSLTMTAYSQEGKLNFIPPPNNVIIDKKKKLCANNCNLKGRCNTVHGTCVCYFGYEGADCSKIRNKTCLDCVFPGVCDQIFKVCIFPSIFNLGSQSFLNKGDGLNVETGADNEQWEISHEGLFHNLKNNKYLEVSGGDLVKKTITTNKLNKPYTNNQIWNHTYIDNNKFIIKTSLNSNLALVPALDSRLTLVNYNVNDTLQHWSFKSSLEECPNNCSKNGICSFSTGKCVCKVGFFGDICNVAETPLRCPKDCSNNGQCDLKTGYCNCQKEYIGETCEILYQDLICPQNCSNNGICSFDQGKCLCSTHFTGFLCTNFVAGVLTTIISVYKNEYLSFSGDNITFSNSSTQWNISLDNHFITELNRCMDISDCIYKPNASIILNSLSVSTTRNQIWMIEKKQNYFFIKVVGSADLALTINSQENSVTLDNFNEYDKKQQWILDYQDYI